MDTDLHNDTGSDRWFESHALYLTHGLLSHLLLVSHSLWPVLPGPTTVKQILGRSNTPGREELLPVPALHPITVSVSALSGQLSGAHAPFPGLFQSSHFIEHQT